MRSMASGHEELQKTSMSSVEEASHSGGPPEAGATGPLLSPGPRPAAASSNGSVGPQDGQILCIKNVAGHIVSAEGSSREGQVPDNAGCGSASVQFCNLYLMSPALLALFKSLGAENKPYTLQEVWRFLNLYLFGNRHLFDITNSSFINCDGDPLGATFGVKRFHFSDVRYLLVKHLHNVGVVPSAPGGIIRSASHNGFPSSSGQSNGYHRQPVLERSISHQSKSSLVHIENGKTNGESRDPSGSSIEVAGSALRSIPPYRVANSGETASTLQSLAVDSIQSRQGIFIKESNGPVLVHESSRGIYNQCDTNTSCGVPLLSDVSVGSRRTETELSCFDEEPVKKISKVQIVLEEDDTPVSNSDAETEYSCQGYETAWCRNTEGEESEEEESENLSVESDFEEYDIVSDDVVSEQPLSDDDSELEDIELAVVTFMYEDDDEVCWGDDDSDSESIEASESDTDTDPDLAKEKWACLKCSKKNKAFMRYCEKCWQQRKNWLPDCPKRRKRRKPRPKKPKKSRIPQIGLKTRVPQESTSTWNSTDGNQECKYFDADGSSRSEVTFADIDKIEKRLSKTLSDASTVSIDEVLEVMTAEEKASGSRRPLEAACSQDSGIGMSQESVSGFSQNMSAVCVSGKYTKLEIENRNDSKGESLYEDLVLLDQDKLLEDPSEVLGKSMASDERVLPSTSNVKGYGTGISKAESEPVHGTLKRKHSTEVFVATRIKRSRSDRTLPEDESLGESDEIDPKDQVQSVIQLLQSKIEFLQSPAGEKFISTGDGKRCMSRFLQAEESDFLSAGITDVSAHKLCSLCFIRPKNAIVVHGRRSHQFSCYLCAKRLLNSKSRCPICRQKIHMVTQNVVV